MDSRQQFEEWASDNGKWPKAVERNGEGYKFMKTHTDWLAWKAARESVVVILPARVENLLDKQYGEFMDSECVEHAINSAGIRTK
jgi:hypothetical protein